MEEIQLLKEALDKYEVYKELLKTQPIDSDYEPMDFKRYFKYYIKIKGIGDRHE
jgi:hypothetical protein